MDRSAIHEIQNTAIAAQQQLRTEYPTVALPDTFKVHDLEQFQDGRNRYRGKMITTSLAEFAEYSNDQNGQKCFIDTETMIAKTFFNIGNEENPGHGDHTAQLKMENTAAFYELNRKNDTRLNQKEMAEWLEDWRDYIQTKGPASSNGELTDIGIIQALSAVRNITIKASSDSEHSDSDFGAARTTMDKIEANAKDQLPVGFVFKCVPYEGLDEREFFMRMSIIAGREAPVISLRIVKLEQHREDMALELKDKLGDTLEASVKRYIGTFAL